jgi:hypothetical protein
VTLVFSLYSSDITPKGDIPLWRQGEVRYAKFRTQFFFVTPQNNISPDNNMLNGYSAKMEIDFESLNPILNLCLPKSS